MPEPFTMAALLGLVTTKALGTLGGKVTEAAWRKLQGDPVKKAFRHALGKALDAYASDGQRLELARPLLDKRGPLTEDAVAKELGRLLGFDSEPDADLIAERWAASLPAWVARVDFVAEARLLLRFLEGELRETEAFRPVFMQRSLDAIAEQAEVSVNQLTLVEASLANLVDLASSRLGEITSALLSAGPDLRSQIRSFTRKISKSTQGFVGRTFAFDALAGFTERSRSGYFLISAKPGVGKTALAAEMVRRGGHIHHFNDRAEGINRVETFVKSVSAQLIIRYGLGISSLPRGAGEDASFLDDVFHQVSDSLPAGGMVVIVVDALDEVDVSDHAGANSLYLPTSLYDGIFVVATVREGARVQLRIDCESEDLVIDQRSLENHRDIREYLGRAAASPASADYRRRHGLSSAAFVDVLEQRSEGNFMYLRYVVPAIEGGIYDDADTDAIPVGLNNYYEDHWNRMQGGDQDAWLRFKLPVLMALTVFEEPLSLDRIAEFSGVVNRARVRAVLGEWKQFLEEVAVEDEGRIQKRYRLYHQSFNDFIARKEEVGDLAITRREAAERARNHLREALFGDG